MSLVAGSPNVVLVDHEGSGIQLKRSDMARMAPGEVGRCFILAAGPGRPTTPVVHCGSPSFRAHLHVCKPQWLNDELVNLYMSLLLERDNRRHELVSATRPDV